MKQEDIQAIVDEVVRRLLAEHAPARDEPVGEVVIPGRVITMESVRDKVDGGGQVVICERAVVTPLVVDYLRENKIALTRRLLAG